MTQKKPIVVIGTGLAGYMFAKEWRKFNTEQALVLISREEGHFYSKPLLSNALMKGKRPNELITTPVDVMRKQLQATIHTHMLVSQIDPLRQTITTSNETIEYETLILATGAKPIMPPLTGDTDALWQVNELSHYASFREVIDQSKSIVILGAGLIGCEFANDLLTNRQMVKVVSLDERPLIRLLPEKISDALQVAFTEAGIEWYLHKTVKAVEKTKSDVTLVTKDGSRITAECALSAIGILPDLTLAKAASLKTNRGILVDRFLQTSHPQIYALGDCIEFEGRVEPYIAPLLLCARALANNLANPGQAQPVHYPQMPITIKTPLYPVVCLPPPPQVDGEWRYESKNDSLIARFFDKNGQVRGFTLGNATGALRLQLTQEVS